MPLDPHRAQSVEIEFVVDTFRQERDENGDLVDVDLQRSAGDRVWVDKMSAHSFCDVKKVAKRIGAGPVLGMSKRVPHKKREPETPPAVDEEDADESAAGRG